MTDLEEEILFRLTTCDLQSVVRLTEEISDSLNKRIPLGVFYKTLIQLEERALIVSMKIGVRKNYAITEAGKRALQHDWNYYRSLYKA